LFSPEENDISLQYAFSLLLASLVTILFDLNAKKFTRFR